MSSTLRKLVLYRPKVCQGKISQKTYVSIEYPTLTGVIRGGGSGQDNNRNALVALMCLGVTGKRAIQ